MNILLGVTGSVAATLTPKCVPELQRIGTVELITTSHAVYFFHPEDVPVRIWTDRDEWPGSRYDREDEVRHILLRNWADLLLIAPLSAHTLGKLANGLADNLLTSVVRAWNRQKPLLLAPAMNTQMWEHPATAEHLRTLGRWFPRLHLIEPVAKTLACGERGIGALAPISVISDAVRQTRSI